MQTIKLTLEYDGRHYHGWQRQPHLPTIQAVVESALQEMTGSSTRISGAGRTDAGVHAEGQVASFHTMKRLPRERWLKALNVRLPRDIVVTRVESVPASFDARRSAVGKVYEYRLLLQPVRSALLAGRAWHWAHRLSISMMRRAARLLVGYHDFSGFQAADPKRSPTRSSDCHVTQCRLLYAPPHLTIRIAADRFLYQMIRTLVGTLIEIGRGRWPVSRISAILDSGDRRLAGPPAPAHGLHLIFVVYPSSPKSASAMTQRSG